MKVRYIGAMDNVISIIPGDEPAQIGPLARGAEVEVSEAHALVLLSPYPNDNYEPADKAAKALVAAPAAEKE